VVFELPGEFNRKICVTFFGDRAEDAASLSEGDAVNVSVNVESREYNGKWYTDVKAWKIARKGGDAGQSASHAPSQNTSTRACGTDSRQSDNARFDGAPFNESTAPTPADEVDDLPF
jgi:hypothetical protein